jgi:hypothetical protein
MTIHPPIDVSACSGETLPALVDEARRAIQPGLDGTRADSKFSGASVS